MTDADDARRKAIDTMARARITTIDIYGDRRGTMLGDQAAAIVDALIAAARSGLGDLPERVAAIEAHMARTIGRVPPKTSCPARSDDAAAGDGSGQPCAGGASSPERAGAEAEGEALPPFERELAAMREVCEAAEQYRTAVLSAHPLTKAGRRLDRALARLREARGGKGDGP